MNKNNITKNQHYIPQFYQRLWSVEDNYIFRLNKSSGRIDKVAIRKNCSGDYIYEPNAKEPNNFFEDRYGEKEKDFSIFLNEFIPLIENGIKIKPSTCDKKMISRIIANFISRHPDFIDEAIRGKFLDLFTVGMEDRKIEKKYLSLVYSGVQEENYSNILMKMNFRIINCNKQNLICFSNKIFSFFRDNYFFLYFPLSPNLLVKFDNFTMNINDANNEINEYFNALCLRTSIREIYANNANVLRIIKDGHLDKVKEYSKMFINEN